MAGYNYSTGRYEFVDGGIKMANYNYSTGRYEFVEDGYGQDIHLNPVPQNVLDMVNSNEEYQERAARAAEEMAAEVDRYMELAGSGVSDFKNIWYALGYESRKIHRFGCLRVGGWDYEIDLLACTVTCEGAASLKIW